ncbi:Na+/H+ antiporter NhaA [Oecophyllibacter saccharovorans]|uniref:Na+/H+ antiporter NhaA n=1 Tax=Oecophyllibacter saccharovorans TaxID=2558360 RepID=UPI0011425E13|nr:Na+/H+ antiporter NhaA [Oecophyllibacter saccharovorans]QDH15131.1 Na+/H+ antiporter NhaA [Oecophyllibacter saccharovorans]
MPAGKKFSERLSGPAVTGILLVLATVLGLGCASTSLAPLYHALLAWVPFPAFPLTVANWISEGLMGVFFTTLALEIKHDLLVGPLASPRRAALPLVGAVGGMAVPGAVAALCGSAFLNLAGAPALQGWAIPTATDAAFTVPILASLPRIPGNLRAFLMALAIFDDLGAIVIMALFYGHSPQLGILAAALVPLLCMGLLAWRKVPQLWAYLPFTLILWALLLRAGLEPTLAGVVLGFCLPLQSGHRLNRQLALPVGLVILPLFAFVSTGVDLRLFTPAFLAAAPFLGPALGLVLGKPLGVCGAVWGVNRLGLLPAMPGVQGRWLLGMGMVCGIGFTMSLLIASLAFGGALPLMQARLGVLAGSLIAALTGWLTLRRACQLSTSSAHSPSG